MMENRPRETPEENQRALDRMKKRYGAPMETYMGGTEAYMVNLLKQGNQPESFRELPRPLRLSFI